MDNLLHIFLSLDQHMYLHYISLHIMLFNSVQNIYQGIFPHRDLLNHPDNLATNNLEHNINSMNCHMYLLGIFNNICS
jgi:hypothetical protein